MYNDDAAVTTTDPSRAPTLTNVTVPYYGAFYRSALYPLLTRINAYLMRWVRKKYRRFQGRREFQQAWQRVTTQYPRFFAHWVWTTAVPAVW